MNDWVLEGQLNSLREEITYLRQSLDETRRRLNAVMDFMNTPIWKLIAPDLFKPQERVSA